MTDMEMQMIRALAEIDRELGMPDDGCNSTENTITAIRLLHAVHRDDTAEIERLRSAIGWLVIRRTDGTVRLNQDPVALEMAGKLMKVPNAEITGRTLAQNEADGA
ncbi:MAG: hypothetical protein B7Z31_00245 [Rhodobacterales bacterium 12-65-15]|nr:MAG: hypothetical protein B7Z31_00245 [Rhodobacterales bacterium 12-65-15]